MYSKNLDLHLITRENYNFYRLNKKKNLVRKLVISFYFTMQLLHYTDAVMIPCDTDSF